ncbi:YceI family protein [Thermus sp.]|uniref:YceI family protein n=1 Tax=Thermus sp. TaxID=275 RepID=UPI003D1112BD
MTRDGLRLLALLGLLAGVALAARYRVTGEAVYEAQAPLGAFSGKNPTLEGEVTYEEASGRLEGQVCLDLSAWDSKEPLRDRHTREMFQVDRYPRACLTLKGLDPAKGVLLGVLDLHGVRREVAIPVRHRTEGQRLLFQADFALRLSDYGLKAPSFMGMRVSDRVRVRVQGQGVAP